MNIGVPSRFACLKIEDDEAPQPRPKEVKKKNDKNLTKKPEPARKEAGNKKVNPGSKQSASKKKKSVSEKQWEEWKEKDNLLVDDQFEGDLQSALMLSKLEYEEYRKNNITSKEVDKKGSNKKKKNKAISLDEFLSNNANNVKEEKLETKEDSNFFETMDQKAKEALLKEQIRKELKERDENIDERISIAQYQEKLQKEKDKNKKLMKEVEELKDELKTVKARNKTLCDMLGHGEMKDKADVLKELERLNTVKNELTEEVTKLHALLEQERSKVANLSESTKHKDKKNKKHA